MKLFLVSEDRRLNVVSGRITPLLLCQLFEIGNITINGLPESARF
jgi:hypothetical protein